MAHESQGSGETPPIQDNYLVLLEEVIRSNQEIMEENRALREEVYARNEVLMRLENRL